MATKIQLRHDSSNKWVEVNPILLPGEIGIELDTKKFKIGDGSTDWNNLQYAVSGSGGGSSVEVDGNTIILNTDGTISSNAVIDQNIGNAKTWTGTLAEYNLIKEKDAETLYYITDDIVEADTVITLDSDLNGLSEVGQAKFDVKANKDEVYTKEESYNKQEVDEAIQDANLVNIGRIQETYATKSMVDGQWTKSYKELANNLNITPAQSFTYDLSSYLPNDGYNYAILLTCSAQTGTTSGNLFEIRVASELVDQHTCFICSAKTSGTQVAMGSGNCFIPVGTNRTIEIYNGVPSTAGTSKIIFLRISGYRRIGTNL